MKPYRRILLLCLVAPLGAAWAAAQPAGGYAVVEPIDYQPPFQVTMGEQPPYVAPIAGPTYDPLVLPVDGASLPAQTPLGAAERADQPSLLPPGTRPGVFQGVNLQSDFMPRLGNDNGLGVHGWQANGVFGFPFFERETPLVVTPQYRTIGLDGPGGTRLPPGYDVPSRLHEAQVDLHHFRRITDRWLFDGAVTLGVYGEADALGDGGAFRVNGRALGVYDWSEHWKVLVGVVYLNRAGYSVIPAAGLLYADDALKVELVFPRPRIAWRLDGGCPPCDERWVYLLGELGGSVWAIRQEDGTPDTLAYSDYRFIVGYEHKVIGGLSRYLELGYVFGRQVEFDNYPNDIPVNDSILLRAGIGF
ncbi:hypothetical protein Pla175_34360 [Pirellulimonas nuda]|uniref:DUF6268 domain-containing protein n=1 Tax=Pirellulimonas nuda TaxID=2528009 RepID=A0A518DEY6_9BACT|nr:DUF6268 family outer membrane beta-barrel protein [Pirellulimonas nuda]QDU90037.1 hypothetical protein Pla175_34360 [Pirellulimonas nuda]